MKKKTVALLLSLVLVFGVVAGGTLAWLTQKTDSVVNTFTYGDINIELTETKPDNKQATIIPSVNIEKNPKVTVKAGSEACWLFVKVEEANWPAFKNEDGSKKVSYSVRTGENEWTLVPGQTDVYYRVVSAVTEDTDFYILTGDTQYVNGVVTVSENLTKAEVNSIAKGTQPKLTFTAYACQKDNVADAATAWAKLTTP